MSAHTQTHITYMGKKTQPRSKLREKKVTTSIEMTMRTERERENSDYV